MHGVGLLISFRVLQKTIDCLNTFAKFKKKENIEAVERLLNTHQTLAKFERAQLGTYALFLAATRVYCFFY